MSDADKLELRFPLLTHCEKLGKREVSAVSAAKVVRSSCSKGSGACQGGAWASWFSKSSVLRWCRFGAQMERGHKHLEWLRLSQVNPNIAGLDGHTPRKGITVKEVRKHCTKDDAWVILKDRVYNITPYLLYHPGGDDILLQVAGKDALPLFNKYHPWVNFEAVLANCFIGMLEPRDKLAEYEARYRKKSGAFGF